MNYERAVVIIVGNDFTVQTCNMLGHLALHIVQSYGVVSTPLGICPQLGAGYTRGVPTQGTLQ
jgi:hypothetical protein